MKHDIHYELSSMTTVTQRRNNKRQHTLIDLALQRTLKIEKCEPTKTSLDIEVQQIHDNDIHVYGNNI